MPDVALIGKVRSRAGPSPDPDSGPHRRSTGPGRLRSAARWLGILATAAAIIAATTMYLVMPLNSNLRYEVGVHDVSAFSAAETFSHRPLAFRLLLDGMADVAERLSFGLSSFEVMLRFLGLLLAASSGLLLWLGLKSRGIAVPGLYALVVVAAVVFTGSGSLEPDWMAVVFAVAGTGIALLGRGRLAWPLAVLASVLLVGAAGMKIITVLTALIGLLVLVVIDRRQAIRTTVSSVVVGLGYVLATMLWAPWEIAWLLDMRLLAPPVDDQLVGRGPRFLLRALLQWPALFFIPPALIIARRRERPVLIIALVLALGPIVAQAKYFNYHAPTLCVVAAVIAFRTLRSTVRPLLGVGIAALALASIGWTMVPPSPRRDLIGAVAVLAVVVLAVAVGWAQNARHRTTKPRGRPVLAACATLALLYPGMTPFATPIMNVTPDGRLVADPPGELTDQETLARQIRARIGGPDVRVTYLTFGKWAYFQQNPTMCRYPSPLFLQRTRFTDEHVGGPSYRWNLACLREPSSEWLIMAENWFKIGKAPRAVQERLAAEFNCDAGFERGHLTVCPRRQ